MIDEVIQTPGRFGMASWLRRRIPTGQECKKTTEMLRRAGLHTVCQEAKCPNLFECFSKRTATFLILGDRCTRNCRFCAIGHGPEGQPDTMEPGRVAEAAAALGLEYVVVTSVTRDDLDDGGAKIFRETILALRSRIPGVITEVLIPDFQGDTAALGEVLVAKPDVLNHNVETVPRLYARVRPQAGYERSLELLAKARKHSPSTLTKSGIMLGLGESRKEVENILADLADAHCQFLTLGQYLQPSAKHEPVDRFVHPEEFLFWKEYAMNLGFQGVVSGPFVRSSYRARDLYRESKESSFF